MPNETELIKACLKKDRAAQKELYLTFRNRLFAVCMRYCSSNEEAQDVLQDGFVKIFRDLNNYRPIAPLYAWMRTVMVRTALENIRRKKSRVSYALRIEEAYHLGEEEVISAGLGSQELMRLVLGLPDDLRTVFNLYAIEGYSHKEIAELLAINEGNSKVRLNRARKNTETTSSYPI